MFHQKPQRVEGRFEEVARSGSFKAVNDFYEANAEVIGSRPKNIADSDADMKSIEDSLNGFSESTRVLIKGLHALGQLHPFVAVAVGAFALVITLDLSRRDNDRKVLAVKIQMQELMAVFFELRHIEHPHEKGRDGMAISARLEGLMEAIAKDVKACGSACDTYLKKSFLAKTVKSGIYESRLAEYGVLFTDYRKQIQLALALHTSLGVDAANQKLDGQDDRLRVIEGKLDMILLFRKLDTPREKDIQKFIEEHGGAKACINNDELLEELVSKSGESFSRISSRDSSGRRSNDLPEIKKKLAKELQEDIDEAFSRNMVLFERKLDIQSKQLTETIQDESDHIISSILAGAHDRIIDPDLQKIWKDMGWKGSVKARHFVLALHDYYTDRLTASDSPLPSVERASPLPSPLGPGSRASAMAAMKKRQDDRWALAYINAAYVQPILEAVDDDGTGFVSVKEVNTFVASRPENWSLPHWIAYWAVGWQASMSRYKDKIYALVQKMFKTLEHVLPSNRRAVDEYLFHPSFWRIELLLRSTRSVNPKIYLDPDLSRITDSYANTEEEMIDANLRDVAYEIDTPATVSLMTGPGRIERYVFPLIYLLLKRHLKVITIACKHVLDTEEFVALNDSLVSVLLAIDYRVQGLEAIFKQTHLDVQARLGNFAFGLFQLSYGDIKRVPIQNSFGMWTDDQESGGGKELSQDDVRASLHHVHVDILKYGIKDGYHSSEFYEFEPGRLKNVSSPVQGTWTGHCLRQEGEEVVSYVLRISIRLSLNKNQIVGKGEDYTGAFGFTGSVDTTRATHEFSFVVTDDDDGLSRTCAGKLDPETDTITAQWRNAGRRVTDNDETLNRPFVLTRTPPSLIRYRYTPDQFLEDPVRSRWNFACAIALHQAQEKLWSRRFFEARFAERKRYVELTTRSLIVLMGLTPQNPLTMAEKGELEYLRRDLNPSEARFYQALAEFDIQKLPWHPAWGCDWCERRITKCRILCIECMTGDLSDNIDLCAICIDKAPTKRGFTHDISHCVVKVEQTLHDYEFARIVDTAKTMSDRIKGLFRTVESAVARGDEDKHATLHEASQEKGSSTDMRCACCGKGATPPCWVCVVCTRDTFVCLDCDLKRRPALLDGPSPGHTFAHALVRIRDSSVSGEGATADDRLFDLEQKLASLESKLMEGFAMLESRMEERLSGLGPQAEEHLTVLESALENRFATADERLAVLDEKVERRLALFESNMENRLRTMEGVLRQIAAQTSALPALYGQVVRDSLRSSSVRER